MKWTPRDSAHQLQRLARHTSIVQAFKYGLIGVAALLVMMVFLVPVLHEEESGRIIFHPAESGDFVAPRMSQPNLQGLDKNDQPYNISAKMAERQEDGSVLLTSLQADMSLASGSQLAFLADTGIFDPEANTLLLPQLVQVFHNSGYDMRTTNVRLNLKSAEVSGDEKIYGQGPLGKLSATGFKVDSDSEYIRFESDVTVTLYPKSKP